MKGERLAWYELASHLHMSLDRVQEETSSSQFVEWKEFLRQKKESEFFTNAKEDYYWAQIAAEIRRSFVKHPNKVRLSEFLLKFRKTQGPGKKKMSIKERTKAAKAYWGAVFSMGKGNK